MRRGFTLVEVSLFLAITAAVFVGIAVGTQNSIFQQRYNDSVQNFAEFLRGVYSQVTNVQNDGDGRSDQAIYGKLVVFGESGDNNAITTYNVIGSVEEKMPNCAEENEILTRLGCLGARITNNGNPVGFVENYKPRWAAQIQTTKSWDDGPAVGYELYLGALLIVRHPSSGTVYTFRSGVSSTEAMDNLVGNFSFDDVDFCVNPNGPDRSNLRKDIRIVAGARNASGVEIVSDGENMVDGINMGNRCEP